MGDQRWRRLYWAAIGAAGVTVLLLGSVMSVAAAERMGSCGDVEITAEQVPTAAVEDPDSYTPVDSLTPAQRTAFRRAVDSDGSAVVDGSVDPFPRVVDGSTYYHVDAIVRPCDFSPRSVLLVGLGFVAVGIVSLASLFRTVRRAGAS